MKLSIITINYNNLKGLQNTIDSIVNQTCRDFEWIVIDGGSTDGSKELILKYQEYISYWCSEPDKGIYNAMNKGIAKAKGEYLNFMNSGDCFADKDVISEFNNGHWCEEVIAGDVVFDGDYNRTRCYPDEDNLDLDFFIKDTICHQASFIKRCLFKIYGMYDESLLMSSDWKFFLEVLIIHNHSYAHWKRLVANYYTDGISSSVKNLTLINNERNHVLNQYRRIINPIRERDQRIQELDLPIMKIFQRKVRRKLELIFKKKVNET